MLKGIRKRLFTIVFGVNTPAGKTFDVLLLWAIVISVTMVILESVPSIDARWHKELIIAEWVFTILFSVEYLVRVFIAPNKWKYIFSFYGVIDLLSIIPTYIGLFIMGAHGFSVIRMLRLMRIFRILKLVRFLKAARILGVALRESRPKIMVFIMGVAAIVIVMGTVMYLVESGHNSGFVSIPKSIYWTIVTITTVGYGDIAPQTVLGQIIASLLMLTGYAIIAVPTGIVTAEAMKVDDIPKSKRQRVCSNCSNKVHHFDAKYCKDCGAKL